MRILVTAGNTLVPVDRVRCLTNIFTGRTGAAIARAAHAKGHGVTLLTSHPETLSEEPTPADERWRLLRFATFDELHHLMRDEVQRGKLEAVIHTAAVADYLTGGVYSSAPGTHFSPESLAWSGAPLTLAERSRQHSQADLMVANTLEGAGTWAFVGTTQFKYSKVPRRELAQSIVAAIESIHEARAHG
jgi:phosphopantothenate-cysteine ligase/phosphopantothenoylcysteine decarboxylase/phosphopantothenate--cysteine ligase